MHKWSVFSEFDDASKAAADFIAERIEDSIRKRGVCHVILPGGNTPSRCLAYLASKKLPWNQVHWYPGDERCYPAGHAERNDVMLEMNLWSKIAVTHIHRIPAEFGAEKAASDYGEIISTVGIFDIAFLGMGEDGHTASLFPDNEALHDPRPVVPVHNSPKPPPDRVSFGMDTLRKASCRIVLTGGSEKSDVIAQIKEGKLLPINCLGDIHWYVDEAAVKLFAP